VRAEKKKNRKIMLKEKRAAETNPSTSKRCFSNSIKYSGK
jgi:hypothetical protein